MRRNGHGGLNLHAARCIPGGEPYLMVRETGEPVLNRIRTSREASHQ